MINIRELISRDKISVIDFTTITKNDMKYNKESLKNICNVSLIDLIKERNNINKEIGKIKRFLNELEGK